MTNTRVFSGDMWTGDRGWSAHTRDDVVAMVRVPDVHTYSRVTHTHGHTRTRTHADKRTALKKRKIIKCLSFILRSSFATMKPNNAAPISCRTGHTRREVKGHLLPFVKLTAKEWEVNCQYPVWHLQSTFRFTSLWWTCPVAARRASNSKLSVGVNLCLYPCFFLAINWQLVQRVIASLYVYLHHPIIKEHHFKKGTIKKSFFFF